MLRPLHLRQFGADRVLINLPNLAIEVIEVDDDAVDYPFADLLDRFEPMQTRDQGVLIAIIANGDRVLQSDGAD